MPCIADHQAEILPKRADARPRLAPQSVAIYVRCEPFENHHLNLLALLRNRRNHSIVEVAADCPGEEIKKQPQRLEQERDVDACAA